jgi:hypothetical protein
MAENMWKKTTSRNWSVITTGLIKGAPAIAFENDSNKDLERLRILISMSIWAIWKSRNKNTISDQDVARQEATKTLKGLQTDLVRKSWNAMRFMDGARRAIRQRYHRKLWADKRFADLDLKQVPPSISLNGMWPGSYSPPCSTQFTSILFFFPFGRNVVFLLFRGVHNNLTRSPHSQHQPKVPKEPHRAPI